MLIDKVCVFQELELPLLKVSAPELVSGVSGESEQKLRELFDLAVVSSFCSLFGLFACFYVCLYMMRSHFWTQST